MSYTDKGSRFVYDEDVYPCPKCRKKEFIEVKWINLNSSDSIKVGCKNCKIYVSSDNWSLTYILWNIKVAKDRENDSDRNKNYIYRLLYRKFLMQQKIKDIDLQIKDFLKSEYLPSYHLKKGDRFETFDNPQGKWEVKSVKAEYAVNIGIFFIIKAVQLLKSGKFGQHIHEFWSNSIGKIQYLDNFVPVTKWSMLYEKDMCKFHEKLGKIINVDPKKRKAVIEINSKQIKINKLAALEVDKSRID